MFRKGVEKVPDSKLKNKTVLSGIFLFVMLAVLFGAAFVSATSYSLSAHNSTLSIVEISDASDLFAYEINLDYTGDEPNVVQANFLGPTSEATYGTSSTSSVFTVFASRLDGSKTGKDGSGQLFNVTHSGTLTRRTGLFLDISLNEEEVDYTSSVSSSSTSSGSSGGGGGPASPTLPSGTDINIISPLELDLDVFTGETKRGEIVITNPGVSTDVDVSFSGDISDIVRVSENSFSLASGDIKSIDYFLEPVSKGLLIGKILFKVRGAVAAEIPVTINARTENFLFDASISVLSRKVSQTGKLRAQIDLLEVSSGERLDVNVNYIVKDFSGNIYLEESETFAVQGTKDFIKEFDIEGLNIPPGKYMLGLEIIYPGAFATSSAQFEVVEGNPAFERTFLLAILVALIVVIGIVAVSWAQRGRRKFSHRHRKN